MKLGEQIISKVDKKGKLKKNKKEEPAPAPTVKKCPFCFSEIHIDATRCPHCTSVLEEIKDKVTE